MSFAPGREEDKVHTSLTVAPVVGWGQTLGLTEAPPTKTSYSGQQRGSALQFGATIGTTQNDKMEEVSSKKKFQEVATANELIKNYLSNIMEQEFIIIVIKLITGNEESIEDSRESIATEIEGLRNSHEEHKYAINEVQNKIEVAIARIEEAERRLGELEDKIMEREEAEKKRDKKIQEYEGRIEELSDAINQTEQYPYHRNSRRRRERERG